MQLRAWEHREPPGAAGSHREPPGAAGSLWEPPGDAGSLWEPPGATGRCWEILGAFGSHRETLGAAGSHREPPGDTRSHREPPGAAGSHWEPSGAGGGRRGQEGAGRTLPKVFGGSVAPRHLDFVLLAARTARDEKPRFKPPDSSSFVAAAAGASHRLCAGSAPTGPFRLSEAAAGTVSLSGTLGQSGEDAFSWARPLNRKCSVPLGVTAPAVCLRQEVRTVRGLFAH